MPQPQQDGGLRKKSPEPFCFFPAISPTVDVEDEGVGNEEIGHAPGDDDDLMAGSNSPTAVSTTTQTTGSRKHGRDDGGTNGVSSTKRRKKGLQGLDGDVSMADGFSETPTPVEEPRTTNGCSVGTQVEDVVELTAADSILLGQEDRSVLTCAWNPVHSTVLATASTDSIARIWNVPLDANPLTQIQNKIISHDPSNLAKRDVTALRWSPQGDLLATGSYDGQGRIWTADGRIRHALSLGTCPVVNLKWNKSADTLLSLFCDGRIIAWNALTGDSRRIYEPGDESAVDMDWVDDTQFVACGDKGSVSRYSLDSDGPLSTYLGHVGEVRCLTWDDVSDRLATGGEDSTVLVRFDLHLSSPHPPRTKPLTRRALSLGLAKTPQRRPLHSRIQTHWPQILHRLPLMAATSRQLILPTEAPHTRVCIKRLHNPALGNCLSSLLARSQTAHRPDRAYFLLTGRRTASIRREWTSCGLAHGERRGDTCI